MAGLRPQVVKMRVQAQKGGMFPSLVCSIRRNDYKLGLSSSLALQCP